MKRKLLLLAGIALVLILVIIIINFGIQSAKDKELRVQDYFPKENMVKQFSGGFENAGFTHVVEKFAGDRAQVRQIDTGAEVMIIYQISEDDIRIVFSQEVSNEEFQDNFIENVEPNRETIILKAPLDVGTSWVDDTGGKYEITGVNVKTRTPAGTFYAIEVTSLRGDFQVKNYYAKNMGLVKRSTKGYGDDQLIKAYILRNGEAEG